MRIYWVKWGKAREKSQLGRDPAFVLRRTHSRRKAAGDENPPLVAVGPDDGGNPVKCSGFEQRPGLARDFDAVHHGLPEDPARTLRDLLTPQRQRERNR